MAVLSLDESLSAYERLTLEEIDAHPESHIPVGKLAEMYHEHPLLPPGRLSNGCWKCFSCGKIVGKKGRWINWCSDCGYDEW